MIPLARPLLGDEETQLVAEVIRSGWITQGPRVAEFEKAFAHRVGAIHAVATANCTAALHLSLLALGIGPGDEVIVNPHSFIASSNAIIYTGARPVFVDIDAQTLNMDPKKVEDALTPRTRAIMVVHQVGRPSPLVELATLARNHNLKLVEDAACAIGSVYQQRPIGDNTYAQLVCFSFHPRKIISTGDGGMITTGDPQLAAKLRLLRQHGMSVNDFDRHGTNAIIAEQYSVIGYNYRLTDVQAAIGIAQLKRLEEILARRRAIAAVYDEELAMIPGVAIFREPEGVRWNHQTYLIRFPSATAAERDTFMKRLLAEGIATRRGIMSIHREQSYVDLFGRQSFPQSEACSDQCVCLPLYVQMSEGEVAQVIDAIRRHVPT